MKKLIVLSLMTISSSILALSPITYPDYFIECTKNFSKIHAMVSQVPLEEDRKEWGKAYLLCLEQSQAESFNCEVEEAEREAKEDFTPIERALSVAKLQVIKKKHMNRFYVK